MTDLDRDVVERKDGREARVVLALGLIVALLVVFPPSSRRNDLEQTAQGYTRVVNGLFIGNRWLETLPPPPESDTKVRFDASIIRLSPRAQEQPQVLAFLRNSFLARDLVQQAPPIWTIDNGQVIELDPTAHSIALPSAPNRRWTGDLRFRISAPATTQSILRGPMGEIILNPPDFSENAADTQAALFNVFGSNQFVTASRVRIQEGRPNNPSYPIADIMLWGSTPVVTAIEDQNANYQVIVDGEQITAPRRRAVAPGGTITIVGPNNNVDQTLTMVESISTSPELSLYRPWGGERQRAATTVDLARAVENSLHRAAANGGLDGQLDADISLTLDGGMQQTLDNTLQAYIANNSPYIGEDYRIGVTVMDALSGDILALGSAMPPREDDTQRPGQEPPLNINFERLQIGSAAKPPIAAAILATRRDLRDLVVIEPGSGEELQTFLGVRFREGNTYGDVRSVPCNFDCFLQTSNNRYAIALMLLANAEGQQSVPTPNGYSRGGAVQQSRPYSTFEARGPDGMPVFTRAQGSVVRMPWHRNIRTLYDIDYEMPTPSREAYSGPRCRRADGRLGDDVFNAVIWRDLLNQYSSTDPCVFYGATPERENFMLDRQFYFETHMLPLMIGGGEARWTNITLAQTYARLVTGQRVSARLYARANGGAEARGTFGLDADVRRQVTHGMSLVTRGPSGTGRAFSEIARLSETRAALASQGAVLGIFAKTGTPAIEEPYYDSRSRSINLLIRLNLLRINQQGTLVLDVGAQTIPLTAATRQTAIDALEADGGARRAIAREQASIPQVVSRLIWHNDRTLEERQGNFQIDNDVLVRVLREDDTRVSYGKVFVFVAARYAAADTVLEDGMVSTGDETPQRAFVVAINIQSNVRERQDRGGSTASRLGAAIYNALIQRRLTAAE